MKTIATLNKQDQEDVKNLKEMINSCFTYGGADKESYNFKRYILPYKNKMNPKLFDLTYTNHLQELKENFVIESNVYTDGEGLTYNNLKPKNQ